MTSMGPSLEQHGVMSQPFSQHISAPQLSFQGIDVEELGLMGAARRGHQRTARRTSLDGSNNHTTNTVRPHSKLPKLLLLLVACVLPVGFVPVSRHQLFVPCVRVMGFDTHVVKKGAWLGASSSS